MILYLQNRIITDTAFRLYVRGHLLLKYRFLRSSYYANAAPNARKSANGRNKNTVYNILGASFEKEKRIDRDPHRHER